jgi:hypothetical protein
MGVYPFTIAILLLVFVIVLCVILECKSEQRVNIVGPSATNTQRIVHIRLIFILAVLLALLWFELLRRNIHLLLFPVVLIPIAIDIVFVYTYKV